MDPTLRSRSKQRGNSFTSCLLTTILVFGGLGFYYFKYFKWRHLDNPTEGVTVAKVEGGGAQYNDFRKRATSQVCDPMEFTLKRIKKIRIKTKKGTVNYPEFEQDVTEVRNKLLSTMTDARLRRVPKVYWKKYKPALEGIGLAYQSINETEESLYQETSSARERLYKSSVKKWNKSNKKISVAREYFRSSSSAGDI